MQKSFISYFSSELVDEVLEKCKKLVLMRPNDPDCYRNLGHAYFKKEDYREAKKAYLKLIELDVKDVSAYLAVGRCHELLGELDEALETFKYALKEKPDWPDTHYWNAKILFTKDRLEQAEKLVATALEINPNFLDALYLQAQIYEKSGDLAASIISLKKIIAMPGVQRKGKNLFPYDIAILFDDSLLLQEAIRQMEAMLRAEPGYADIHFKLGMAYRKMGRKEDAMAEFKKALKLNPNMHLARHYYWHWGENGEPDK